MARYARQTATWKQNFGITGGKGTTRRAPTRCYHNYCEQNYHPAARMPSTVGQLEKLEPTVEYKKDSRRGYWMIQRGLPS
ncbi:hypothetical protein K0M31_007286 [Melipona bicolor]|uniref:Uncharacterized protein n=1 Tax=Melipona bicolor TaxID=60889 RepID=A0AA40KVJ1_9HYME|nr:hypothetical protein K0M31_007286 [Melipona bicolor]